MRFSSNTLVISSIFSLPDKKKTDRQNNTPSASFFPPLMAAESILKNREVSAMLKHGFISDPTFSPSRLFLPRVSSPSPPPSFEKTRSSPTLFEMMSEEQSHHQQQRESKPSEEKNRKIQERVSKILADAPFQNPIWDGGVGDVKLTVRSKDGFKVLMNVHRRVLAGSSRFFAEKLGREAVAVEICDCDDVEVYVEVVVLMYCEEDLRRRLVREEVGKVIGLLKV